MLYKWRDLNCFGEEIAKAFLGKCLGIEMEGQAEVSQASLRGWNKAANRTCGIRSVIGRLGSDIGGLVATLRYFSHFLRKNGSNLQHF